MKTVKKLFKILNLLAEHKDLRIQDIADKLDLNKSTVFRFINVLEENGCVLRDNNSKRYRLGLYFLKLGTIVKDSLDIEKIVIAPMEELRKITGETIHLAYFNGKEIIYILKVESRHPVRLESKIGNVASSYCTGLGKAILAFQDNETIERIISSLDFKPRTINTITNRKDLLEELKKIRENNYALDNSEHENDVNCVAFPLKDYNSKVKYAISISAIKSRLDIKGLLEYKDIILEKIEIISRNMEHIVL